MTTTMEKFNPAAVATTTTGDLTSGQTSIACNDLTGWTNFPCAFTINRGLSDEETCLAAGKSTNTLTGVTRDYDQRNSSVGQAHSGTITIEHTTTSFFFNKIRGLMQADTAGQIAYHDGSDWQKLTVGSTNEILRVSSGLPSWRSLSSLIDDIMSGEANEQLFRRESGSWVNSFKSVPVFASTTARDAAITSPVNGMVCIVTSGDSSDGFYEYNGTSWRKGPGWNAPWGVMTTSSATSNQTGISTAADITSPAAVSWTGVTGRLYEITSSISPLQVSSTGNQQIIGYDSASGSSGNVVTQSPTTSITAGSVGPVPHVCFMTGSGTLNFHLRASTSAGTITIQNATEKGWIVVKDIGPTGNPA